MRINWLKLSAVAVLLALGGAAQASVVHDDAFTDASGTNNGLVDYRSVGTFDVGYLSASAQSAQVSFELFGSKSVDGDNAWQDNYVFQLNGTTLFEGTFNLGGGGDNQVITNAGFAFAPVSFGHFQGGKVTVSGTVSLLAGANTFTFGFASPGSANGGGQPLDDEGWGVNDFSVEVAAVPLPAGLPLLAGALFGLGALALRRRATRV